MLQDMTRLAHVCVCLGPGVFSLPVSSSLLGLSLSVFVSVWLCVIDSFCVPHPDVPFWPHVTLCLCVSERSSPSALLLHCGYSCASRPFSHILVPVSQHREGNSEPEELTGLMGPAGVHWWLCLSLWKENDRVDLGEVTYPHRTSVSSDEK